MDLERYNRSFEEHVMSIEEEADARLQAFRQSCVRNFINRLTKQQQEWETTFRELLSKSQEDVPELRSVTFADRPSIRIIDDEQPPTLQLQSSNETSLRTTNEPAAPAEQIKTEPEANLKDSGAPKRDVSVTKPLLDSDGDKLIIDPFPKDAEDLFTNNLAIKEFIRIQEQQEQNRKLLHELNTNSSLKPFKNELNLFIRTQINSISNSDFHHINNKTRLLTDLFRGQTITFQEKQISVMKHPQGQLFAMDLAAQTFVTVGTRLVNSVPAIAKSMASVINGIAKNNFPIFRDLLIGHLQERCPFLIPMYPHRADFGTQPDSQVKYMIACGYSQDIKTQTLESEEKYLARMRSMALVYACIQIQQDNKCQAWGWLASFLSLKPQPVITATILQAFLQETSKTLHAVYRKQYMKMLLFIQNDYIKMIEKVLKQPSDKQSLIKLKNQVSDDIKEAF
uniref:mRNA export factor GLE1 n=1 Tax=Aceria tosichella TaxID=561515 RepID=A0A6G1SBW7_9ACAR